MLLRGIDFSVLSQALAKLLVVSQKVTMKTKEVVKIGIKRTD